MGLVGRHWAYVWIVPRRRSYLVVLVTALVAFTSWVPSPASAAVVGGSSAGFFGRIAGVVAWAGQQPGSDIGTGVGSETKAFMVDLAGATQPARFQTDWSMDVTYPNECGRRLVGQSTRVFTGGPSQFDYPVGDLLAYSTSTNFDPRTWTALPTSGGAYHLYSLLADSGIEVEATHSCNDFDNGPQSIAGLFEVAMATGAPNDLGPYLLDWGAAAAGWTRLSGCVRIDRSTPDLFDVTERKWSLALDSGWIDQDVDGLHDSVELQTGTEPRVWDTDGDGWSDGAEDRDQDGSVDPGESDPRVNDKTGTSCRVLDLSTDEPEGGGFLWSVPSRFDGNDHDGDGIADYFAPSGHLGPISPSSWPMDFDASDPISGECPGVQYQLMEGLSILETSTSCQFRHYFPSQGGHTVSLVVTLPDGTVNTTTQDVWIRDWLIISLGDSVASGEGNPDIAGDVEIELPSRLNLAAVKKFHGPCVGQTPNPSSCAEAWQDRNQDTAVSRCHRSAKAGPALAAATLENADPHSSVTFIHLACSGAMITKGILDPYGGLGIYDPSDLLPPQWSQALLLKGQRVPDAVLLSIGGNDFGFGELVERCASSGDTVPRAFGPAERDCDDPKLKPAIDLDKRASKLVKRFAVLEPFLDQLIPQRSRVLITDLFDPSRAEDGDFCGDRPLPIPFGPDEVLGEDGSILNNLPVGIDYDEAKFAGEVILPALNGAIADGARAAGWTAITGMADRFRTHGYCAEASERWVRQWTESIRMQGNDRGAIHPNEDGHEAYGEAIFDQLSEWFLTP